MDARGESKMSDPNYEYIKDAIVESIEYGDFEGAETLAGNLEELEDFDAEEENEE